jgi:hypothetical protein
MPRGPRGPRPFYFFSIGQISKKIGLSEQLRRHCRYRCESALFTLFYIITVSRVKNQYDTADNAVGGIISVSSPKYLQNTWIAMCEWSLPCARYGPAGLAFLPPEGATGRKKDALKV